MKGGSGNIGLVAESSTREAAKFVGNVLVFDNSGATQAVELGQDAGGYDGAAKFNGNVRIFDTSGATLVMEAGPRSGLRRGI